MTQKQALKILKAGHSAFITGSPGCGKTYVINEFIKHCKKSERNVAITASTGIAATHIGGTTIHSWSGMKIKEYLETTDIYDILRNKANMQTFNSVDTLIIDEISMISGAFLDSLSELLRIARSSFEPFGGIQVVISGDLFQLPPISKKDNGFVHESQVFNSDFFKICYIDELHRFKENDKLPTILNNIRKLTVDDYDIEAIKQTYNNKFPENIEPTRIYTHKYRVANHNERMYKSLESDKEYEYKAICKGNASQCKTLLRNLLSPEVLKLKVGAVVMFTKNNKSAGYVNGTMGKVIGFEFIKGKYYPIVQTADKVITAKHETWDMVIDNKVVASVSQIPLALSWAITVHKSQGISVDYAEMDLSKCFEYGQGYVALSRARSINGLRVVGMNNMAFCVDENIAAFDIKLIKKSELVERELI